MDIILKLIWSVCQLYVQDQSYCILIKSEFHDWNLYFEQFNDRNLTAMFVPAAVIYNSACELDSFDS